MGICIGSIYTMLRIERTWVERGRTEGWNDKQLLITSFFPSWVGESSECWDLFRKEGTRGGGGEFGRVNNFKNSQRYVYMGVFLFGFCWVQCKGHYVSELKFFFWKGIKVCRYMHFLFDSWWNVISYTSICVCVCVLPLKERMILSNEKIWDWIRAKERWSSLFIWHQRLSFGYWPRADWWEGHPCGRFIMNFEWTHSDLLRVLLRYFKALCLLPEEYLLVLVMAPGGSVRVNVENWPACSLDAWLADGAGRLYAI